MKAKTPTSNRPPKRLLFTDAEYDRLTLIALSGGPATAKQIHRFLGRCEEMRVREIMLRCILSGMVNIHLTEGEFQVAGRSEPIPNLPAIS